MELCGEEKAEDGAKAEVEADVGERVKFSAFLEVGEMAKVKLVVERGVVNWAREEGKDCNDEGEVDGAVDGVDAKAIAEARDECVDVELLRGLLRVVLIASGGGGLGLRIRFG